MSKFYDVEQSSIEWFNLRLGKFTASNFADLFMGKSTQGYKKAILKVVYERLTQERPEDFKSDYMQRGNDLEPFAVRQYEGMTFKKVHNGGFFELNEWIGASPDGLIGTDGLLQIKSPAWNTMLDYLNTGVVPVDYVTQCQGELMVTGREWCDLYFYHPKLKPIINRIVKNEQVQENIMAEINTAIKEAEKMLNKLTQKSILI